MQNRQASKVEDLVLQVPSSMALSGGVAINPMVNKFQERLSLPARASLGRLIRSGAGGQQICPFLAPGGLRLNHIELRYGVPH